MLTPLEFYIRGGDDRLGPLHVDVVDSPTIGQMVLHCEYPEYMNRQPRDLSVAGAVSLPRGTRVTVLAETNKDIVQAQIDDVSDEQTPVAHRFDLTQDGSPGGRRFEYVVEALDRDTTLRFTLLDVDGIRSRDPVRLSLAAIDDEAPQVRVQLSGIGTAITPQARAADYAVKSRMITAWPRPGSNATPTTSEPAEQPLETKIEGRDLLAVEEAIEVEHFALHRSRSFIWRSSQPDTCGLAGGAKTGVSQRYVLDVVTPEQLRFDSRSPRAVAPPAVRNDRPGADRNSRRAGAHRSGRRSRAGGQGRRRRALLPIPPPKARRGPIRRPPSSGFSPHDVSRPSGPCKIRSGAWTKHWVWRWPSMRSARNWSIIGSIRKS